MSSITRESNFGEGALFSHHISRRGMAVQRCQVSDADCDRNKDKQWLRYRVDTFDMLARLVTSVLGLPRCRGLDYVIEKTT